MDWLNGMSGESLRVMMLFTCSSVTWVLSGGSSSSWGSHPSSNASRADFSNRPSGLIPAPRPFRGSACLPESVFRGMENGMQLYTVYNYSIAYPAPGNASTQETSQFSQAFRSQPAIALGQIHSNHPETPVKHR